jgi:hypothetical protein
MFCIVRAILSILRTKGKFYGHLVHFVVSYVLVCCTEKNLATLQHFHLILFPPSTY